MKTKIIPIAIVLLLISLGGWKYYTSKNPHVEKQLVGNELPIDTSTSSEVVEITQNTQITTERPVGGEIKGVIEVGASGFNSFVVLMDKNDNWELISKEFGESLAYEGFATTDDVKLGLKKYLSKMFEKGVAGRNAHFVISSGALKNPKTEIIAKAIEEMGYVVNRIKANEEGQYALKALLPSNYKNNSFVVDIGSGNTKISWYENGRVKSLEGPGAKYYQDGLKDSDVYSKIQSLCSSIPKNLQENCFIIGGVPFKLASESRNQQERFTFLETSHEYNFGDDVKLKSGLNIYKAIEESTSTNNFIFDWDSNFTIGFLLNLN